MSENQKEGISISLRWVIPLLTITGSLFAGFYQGKAQSDTNKFLIDSNKVRVDKIEKDQKLDHDKVITIESDVKNIKKSIDKIDSKLDKLLDRSK